MYTCNFGVSILPSFQGDALEVHGDGIVWGCRSYALYIQQVIAFA